MRLTCRCTLFAVTAMAALTVATRAETVLFANITHDQETGTAGTTPPMTTTGEPRPMPFGTAVLTLNDAQTALAWTATVNNLDITGTQTPDINDNLVAAHIHGPAPAGANGGVKWGFFGAPDNDNNPDSLIVTPFATGVGGTFSSVWDAPEGNSTTLAEQLPSILGGLTYLNFHTTQFGGGEIRGQIGVVPEPGTFVLLGTAGLPLLALRRRRRS